MIDLLFLVPPPEVVAQTSVFTGRHAFETFASIMIANFHNSFVALHCGDPIHWQLFRPAQTGKLRSFPCSLHLRLVSRFTPKSTVRGDAITVRTTVSPSISPADSITSRNASTAEGDHYIQPRINSASKTEMQKCRRTANVIVPDQWAWSPGAFTHAHIRAALRANYARANIRHNYQQTPVGCCCWKPSCQLRSASFSPRDDVAPGVRRTEPGRRTATRYVGVNRGRRPLHSSAGGGPLGS